MQNCTFFRVQLRVTKRNSESMDFFRLDFIHKLHYLHTTLIPQWLRHRNGEVISDEAYWIMALIWRISPEWVHWVHCDNNRKERTSSGALRCIMGDNVLSAIREPLWLHSHHISRLANHFSDQSRSTRAAELSHAAPTQSTLLCTCLYLSGG